MMQIIDWTGYCKMMSLLLVLYYGFIGAKYFKYELLNVFGIKRVTNQKASVPVNDMKDPVEG
ncbi:hypothetical protein [Pinibacter aurantiacus]|uniref:Uncharacterized protein n=1 Tax=Pinibacter aurantiacus TaxID=2851599 RepID=A0A9E2S9N5_9BACT|nr:hypothetical protein [Pinibacter aurantiacus]MBV4357322.1 hypothetical protein [Pinibacter aurantiacus]